LLAGGDVLSTPQVRRVLTELPTCRLINGYGPTEGTTFTCCHTVTIESARRSSVPIGRPIANTRVYVLDQNRQPVPFGDEGELWIAGDGVARGYVNRPELTAERFVVHRFEGGRDERLYRSGDIVRYLPAGALEVVGRVAALAQFPGVTEAVVITRQDASAERYLASYLRTATETFDADACRAFLRQRLPSYMVPATFTVLDRFPLTVNGKVDRRLLPTPDVQRDTTRPPVHVPSSGVERVIADAWRTALGTTNVGLDDNFFDLGGHSLLLVQVQARLQASLGREIPIVELFQYPTIRALTAHLSATTAPALRTT
jgi:acyl-CoA synthetase (AMP-forming)/AMP-acid ligase II/acyl carrier protein